MSTYCFTAVSVSVGVSVSVSVSVSVRSHPKAPPARFLAHLWGAYAIPLALSVVRRPSSVVCRLCPP